MPKTEKIENLAWVLPRPGKSHYLGSFPLHFEVKLLRLLGVDPRSHSKEELKDLILHPFGGKAEFGFRVDIKPEVSPDLVGDAHHLPEEWTGKFAIVILDPPYNDGYSERLYQTQGIPLKWSLYSQEAVRVCKEGGFIVSYHNRATPSIPGTVLVKRIFVEHRMWHSLRCVHIHQKNTAAWRKEGNDRNPDHPEAEPP